MNYFKSGIVVLMLLFSALAQAQDSVTEVRANATWTFTGFPLNGAVVTPNDSTDLAEPGYVRANDPGNISAICHNGTTQITVGLAAGEFFPCLVRRVRSTGTTVTTIHLFW